MATVTEGKNTDEMERMSEADYATAFAVEHSGLPDARPAAWIVSSPCPTWCGGGHIDWGDHDSHPSDRNHSGAGRLGHDVRVPNRMGGIDSEYYAMIWQNASDLAPHIIIGGGDLEPMGMHLSPAEAGLLIERLGELLREVYR